MALEELMKWLVGGGSLVGLLSWLSYKAIGCMSRKEHREICMESSERQEKQLTELKDIVSKHVEKASDHRHKMYGEMQRLANELKLVRIEAGRVDMKLENVKEDVAEIKAELRQRGSRGTEID